MKYIKFVIKEKSHILKTIFILININKPLMHKLNIHKNIISKYKYINYKITSLFSIVVLNIKRKSDIKGT